MSPREMPVGKGCSSLLPQASSEGGRHLFPGSSVPRNCATAQDRRSATSCKFTSKRRTFSGEESRVLHRVSGSGSCLPSVPQADVFHALARTPSILSAVGPASLSWEERAHSDCFFLSIRFVVRNGAFFPFLKPPRCYSHLEPFPLLLLPLWCGTPMCPQRVSLHVPTSLCMSPACPQGACVSDSLGTSAVPLRGLCVTSCPAPHSPRSHPVTPV